MVYAADNQVYPVSYQFAQGNNNTIARGASYGIAFHPGYYGRYLVHPYWLVQTDRGSCCRLFPIRSDNHNLPKLS
jgi:hypothetical protein